jgi:predicted RND superfamily exporter protein
MKKKEYSKVITSIVVGLFSATAIGFIAFVCYEMHRLRDLTPVAYIGTGITGLLAIVMGVYAWRAKAKSQCDLEWEKTKQLTLFREKHPEYFTQGKINSDDFENYSDGGVI